MLSRAMLVFVALLACHGGDVRADLFKCVGKDGKVAYQSDPCPASVNEQRLRAQPEGPSAGGPSGPMKEGWVEKQVNAMKNGCMREGFEGGKRGWVSAGGDPKKLPEAAARAAVEKSCTCMMRRLTTSMTFSEYEADPIANLARFASGECTVELRGFNK